MEKAEIEKYGLDLLQKSLFPLPRELNELDWKCDLSDNTEKLKKHIWLLFMTSSANALTRRGLLI